MPGFGSIGQLAIGQVTIVTAEFFPDKWMQPLSEPVRLRPGLRAGQQQAHFFDPVPVVSFSWFEALSEPVRSPPRSPAALYPNFFMQPAPSPFVASGWFMPLSEPVRFRPGLKAALQQFFTTDPTVIPLTHGLIPWFAPLNEPVRKLPGLDAARQQFLAAPSQLRPTPTTTAVLDALETKDVFLGGIAIFNPPASAEIGVVDTTFFAAEIGLIQTTPGGSIASVQISISII
jgi:hypothetical protein